MTHLIWESMLLGVVAWMIGLFYNYTLQNNAIFSKFGALLDSWVNFYDYISEDYEARPIDKFKAWVANPLGACIYCSTTWIAIFISVIYLLSFNIPIGLWNSIICILAIIGTQHIFVRMWCYIKTNVDKANED